MRQAYALTWLFTAELADGTIFEQTPEDRSATRTEIILADDHDQRLVIEREDSEWQRLDQAIRAGAEQLPLQGRLWYWRTYSAKTDIAGAIERGEVTRFSLRSAAHPEQVVLLLLRDDSEAGHQAGDLFIWQAESMSVKVPFSLPERLWKLKNYPGMQREFRPALRLVYERDVTCVGMPGAMEVVDVAYRIGWEAEVLGERVRHVLEVR